MAKPVHEFETYVHSMELLRGEGWVGEEYTTICRPCVVGTDSGVLPVEYEDLEHVQVTRNFLNRTQMFLDTLLRDED